MDNKITNYAKYPTLGYSFLPLPKSFRKLALHNDDQLLHESYHSRGEYYRYANIYLVNIIEYLTNQLVKYLTSSYPKLHYTNIWFGYFLNILPTLSGL